MASNAVTVLLQTMVAQSDTLTIRFSIYQYAWRYVQTHYQEMLVGYGYRNLGNLVSGFLRSANYNVVLKGFENGFFDTVFVYGLAGFALFVLLIYDGVQSMWTTSYGKLIGVLFILSVISINMTLSYMFPSFVYPFVTLLLVIIPADLHLKEQTITD
jgi:hypothetical protein